MEPITHSYIRSVYDDMAERYADIMYTLSYNDIDYIIDTLSLEYAISSIDAADDDYSIVEDVIFNTLDNL